MEMMDLLNFSIEKDCIRSMDKNYYFFRIKPPNFTTLDTSQQENCRNNFENALRNIEDIPLNIFAMDKTVNLDANRSYVKTFDNNFEDMKNDILQSLDSMEVNSGNTERAYYFILAAQSTREEEQIERILKVNRFNVQLAGSDELTAVMRCFLLREFIDLPIYICEEAHDE